MILFLLRLFGTLLARMPTPAIRAIVAFAASTIYLVGRQRRRTLLANLTHAFPERDPRWITSMARESVRQMVEFGLLAVSLPCFSEKRLRQIFFLSPSSEKILREKAVAKRAVVALPTHLGPQDGLAILPLLVPEISSVGVIYRPLKNQTVDTWIRESRGRFGVELFSRKRGLQEALRLLKANKWLGLLFDQNSSAQGTLITFLDRVASVTELPGILVARHKADVVFLYAARRHFWRIELCAEPGPATTERDEVNLSANLWLEKLLRENDELVPSWLWAHNRWRHQRVPRLSLRSRKNLLEKQNAFLGRAQVPRREPFFIRLPDNHEEVVALLPLLRAMRQSRPDVAFTVIGKTNLLPLVREPNLCEDAIPLPPPSPGYFFFFRRLRRRFPTAYFLFHNALRADIEAWFTGAPHRFGIERPGKRRFLINRTWTIPADFVTKVASREETWKAFLHANGLDDT